jgi:hypothetical protein
VSAYTFAIGERIRRLVADSGWRHKRHIPEWIARAGVRWSSDFTGSFPAAR